MNNQSDYQNQNQQYNQGYGYNQQPNQGGYIPPNQYTNVTSTPLIQNSTPALVNNQVTPNQHESDNLRAALKSNGQFVTCPFCRTQGMTRTEQSCSVGNIICCICCGGIGWLIFQAVRGKDINCYDANHYCGKCNTNLSSYSAC